MYTKPNNFFVKKNNKNKDEKQHAYSMSITLTTKKITLKNKIQILKKY